MTIYIDLCDSARASVPKAWLRDPRLSGQDKGYLAYMGSLESGEPFSVKSMAAEMADKESAIRAGLNRLQEYGYLRRETVRDAGSRIVGATFYLSEVPTPQPRPRGAGTPLVYYIRRAPDRAIKIGWSADLGSRVAHLRAEHGALDVLATEPGAGDVEDERHQQFRSAALGREWFRPVPDLLMHIAGLNGAEVSV